MIKLVGLCGAASSGKDTFGELLSQEHGYSSVAFADIIRDSFAVLNPIVGVSIVDDGQEMVCLRYTDAVKSFGYQDAKKNVPEIRALLQRLGDVGRSLFDEDFWVDFLMKKIDATPSVKYVVTDVRFPNEAQSVRERGGVTVLIERDGYIPANSHPAENSLSDEHYDYKLQNNGDLADLKKIVADFVSRELT